MPSHPQPGVTPLERARIVELRRCVPWLGLRRIARALDLSLHAVRQALVERTPRQQLAGDDLPRCTECGAKLTVEPCLACAAYEAIERRHAARG